MNMRLSIAFFCLLFHHSFAQISIPTIGGQTESGKPNKVKQHAFWDASVSAKEVAVGDEVELVLNATVEEGWYMYSSDFDPNLGPIVTTVTLKKSGDYESVGTLKAIHPKKKFDEIWGGDITYFVGKAEFRQKVKVLASDVILEGTVEYQTCTIKDGACVSGEYDFKVAIKANPKKSSDIKTKVNSTEKELPKEKVVVPESPNVVSVNTASAQTDVLDTMQKSAATPEEAALAPVKPIKEFSLWMFFVEAFLFGLAGLLTPCVFPMIPMTVSFFTKSSKSHAEAVRKGAIYGLSIMFIYTVIGTLVAVFFGADAANFISTHWLPNLFFFVVFVVFAASFLGLFDITLPHWLVNKADAQSDQGGLVGIFFMAFTIALVSFSCTGPLVGTILIESAGGKFVKPIIGMLGFSLGFALPFTLFAMFPSWLKALPKSGGWLNTVKVSLGFLELALAMKFFSQADQVYHWHLLDREIFIAIWVVIFTLMGLYLLRFFKLSHDDEDYTAQAVNVPRLFFAMSSLVFVVYLVPGMFGSPLKALSGYLPPLSTADFVLGQSSVAGQPVAKSNLCEEPKHAELFHLPHGLTGYYDLKQAQACSKAVNKPLFIDFTGHGCANCREMEANVWSDPAVLKRLKEDFVIVSLYVDERFELPKEAWYVSSYDGKKKTTIGKQNADLEIRLFNNNAQPLYVIADENGKALVEPRAFDRDVEAFVRFLDEGYKAYQK
jgi:thiol:disulfide interchange protein